MSESPRTCATCACCLRIEPPVLASKQIPDPTRMRTQYVCRLNPPMTVTIPGQGQGIMQQPTAPDQVCWWWKEPGSLPGDPPYVKVNGPVETKPFP